MELQCSGHLLGLHYLGMIDWIIGHVVELKSPALLPGIQEIGRTIIRLKAPALPSSHMICLSGVAFAHPESLLSIVKSGVILVGAHE